MRLLVLSSIFLLFLTASCGGDKHLPSSNPPEYDPKRVYTEPAVPLPSVVQPAKPTELESLRSKLDSLEAGQKAQGEGKKIPFDENSVQLLKGVRTPCEALLRMTPGLGGAQLFTGTDGIALKKPLGPDADGIARRMDEHMAEGLKHSLGPGATDCPISVRPQKKSGLSQPARLVLVHTTPDRPLLLAQTGRPNTSQDNYEVETHSNPGGQ